jgi:hypothetical protein
MNVTRALVILTEMKSISVSLTTDPPTTLATATTAAG